jgi:hypothetical protein
MTTQRPPKSFARFLAIACLLAMSCFQANAARAQVIDLVTPFDFSGLPQGTPLAVAFGLRDAIFEAERVWESRLIGVSAELPGFIQRSAAPVQISIVVAGIDGEGMILGFAGPDSTLSLTVTRPYVFAQTATVTLDGEDVEPLVLAGLMDEVVLHEMAHALGFGTLWDPNRLTLGPFGNYTGTYALKQYRIDADKPDALFVPRQLGPDLVPGGHWDAGDEFFIDVLPGRPDLMIPFLSAAPAISETTWASFADLGFKVNGINENAGVPAPGAGATPGTGGRGPRMIPAR